MTGCVKCHVYFSTFVLANESWFFLCRVLSFIFYWFGMVRRKLTIPERWQAVGMHNGGFSHRRVADRRRLITVRVLMRPPNAKLPRSAPVVLDISRSSLCVVLRGLPARGRSVTFPIWRKRCISRTMMEWLTLKWSATLLWLKPPLCMPTACLYDRVCKVPRVLFNICACERKLIFFV
jgi:hypothetical protein